MKRTMCRESPLSRRTCGTTAAGVSPAAAAPGRAELPEGAAGAAGLGAPASGEKPVAAAWASGGGAWSTVMTTGGSQ